VVLDSGYDARSLVEAWNGASWRVVRTPLLRTSRRDLLFVAFAVSDSDVQAVGEQQDSSGRFATLVEHWNGARWSVVRSPDPGERRQPLLRVSAVDPRRRLGGRSAQRPDG